MHKKLITGYGIGAFAVIMTAIVLFSVSIVSKVETGTNEAEGSFTSILQQTSGTALRTGFMSDQFIASMTDMCQSTKMLSAFVISTSSGFVFAWPDQTNSIQYDARGKARITDTSLFSKSFSANIDVGNGTADAIVITAVIRVLSPEAVYDASRVSFFIILVLLLVTLLVLVWPAIPVRSAENAVFATDDTAIAVDDVRNDEEEPDSDILPHKIETQTEFEESTGSSMDAEVASGNEPMPEHDDSAIPAGLFSPVTGIGWEQYLSERLDSELVRAASSEQDLALIVIRISGLLHTDLLARKITAELIDVFRFKDMLFEFGQNGFAGILQNTNLDQAMKEADTIYAKIDSLFMDTGFSGQMTIGITTRTARLLPASRMIDEAVSAAKKALEEPSLPIVAFRANPEKYRDFVAEKK